MIYFLIIVIILVILFAFYEIKNLKDKNRELELRINMILEESGKKEFSTLYVSGELRNKLLELKHNGKSIEAIRMLRESTTYDLLGAKTYIENLH